MMQIILICIELIVMAIDLPPVPPGNETLALLAGSIAHVFDYLTTGNARAGLRARLLLDRLEDGGPGDPAVTGIEPLRQAVMDCRP